MAAAAYRSGDRLYDNSQAKWFAFDKPDVIHTEILAPDTTIVPAWVFDRGVLWNQVERSEKRKDAQLAREVELTLPRELGKDEQVALVRSFVREHYTSKGMVADFAIHKPSASDGLEQPHAHILLTLRRLDPATETGFAASKDRSWNESEEVFQEVAEARKRYNDTELPEDLAALDTAEAKRNVNVWRAGWAQAANTALADSGSAARIDHRTLEKQGIFRPPVPNIGLARHIEKAYSYLKDRLTQWVAVKKRTQLYDELEQYKFRDPVRVAEFVLRLGDMAEDLASHFKRSEPIQEVPIER